MSILSQLHSSFDNLSFSLEQIEAMLTAIQATELTELKLDTLLNYLGALSTIVEITKIRCEELFNQVLAISELKT